MSWRLTQSRGGSRAAATSKMECFAIIVNGWKPLTIITKSSILDVAAVLDPLLQSIAFAKLILLNSIFKKYYPFSETNLVFRKIVLIIQNIFSSILFPMQPQVKLISGIFCFKMFCWYFLTWMIVSHTKCLISQKFSLNLIIWLWIT